MDDHQQGKKYSNTYEKQYHNLKMLHYKLKSCIQNLQ